MTGTSLSRAWREWWWLAVAGLSVTTIVLGIAGSRGSFPDRAYAALQLFVLSFSQPPGQPVSTELQVARFLAPAVFGYATLRAVLALFDERLQALRARFYRSHIVICGVGEQTAALVKGFAASGRVVVVGADPAQPFGRECRNAGAVVLAGNPRDAETLRWAGLTRAEHLVAVGADDGENAQIAAQAIELGSLRHGRPLHAFIHLSDPKLCSLLLGSTLGATKVRLEFFNVYERAALMLLEQHWPLVDSNGPPHLLVAGAGRLGRALIARAAWEWHERRQSRPDLGRMRVSIVDRESEAQALRLIRRYPAIEAVCELRRYLTDVESPEFDRLADTDPDLIRSIDVAYVLFGDESRSASATLSLEAQARGPFTIVTRLRDAEGGLATLLRREAARTQVQIILFSLGRVYEPSRVLEGTRGVLARSIHEEYLSRLAQTEAAPYAQPWVELSPEGRERNLRQADALKDQLETLGYRLGPLLDWTAPSIDFAPAEVDRMAQMEHERWLAERLEEGWTYGERRDEHARRHPALQAWGALPEELKDANHELVRGRPTLLARAGIQVYRA